MRVKRLSVATAILTALAFVLLDAGQRPAPAPPPAPPLPMPAILKGYPPVTAARLLKPADDEWLMIRRTYDGWGYSPLDQITTANVARLQPVWVFSTGAVNGHEAPPLVNGGVMFVSTPGNQVIAIDARTRPTALALPAPDSRGRRRHAPDLARRRALRRQGVSPGKRGRARRARRPHREGSVDGRGRREPARLLHDAGAAGGGRPRDDRRLGRRVRHSRIRGGLRRGDRQAGVEDLHRAGARRARQRDVAQGRCSGRPAAHRCG